MNTDAFRSSLSSFLGSAKEYGIHAYVVLKEEEEDAHPLTLDIEDEALSSLKDLFIEEIHSVFLTAEPAQIMALSNADERQNVIYHYDFEIPKELRSLTDVIKTDDHQTFSRKKHGVRSIKAIIIEIGDNEQQLTLYKTMAPVNIFTPTSFYLGAGEHDQRFKELKSDFLRITTKFHFIQFQGSVLILDLSTLERFFGFHEVIKKEATAGYNAILKTSVLDNPEALLELIDNVTYARKLTKISTRSPIITQRIPAASIISFCKSHKATKGKLRFNEDETRIILDTNVSKDLLIKLFMDDFLMSELTKLHYESLAKDPIE